MPVEIDRAVCLIRFLNRNCPAQIVIFAVAVRHDHIQTIDRAALKDRDENFFLTETII